MKFAMSRVVAMAVCSAAFLLTGCATTKAPLDYTAFKQSKPRSILVMPPMNQTPEVNAPAGVLAQVTLPLAEAGYYVLPVAVTEETFKQNGIQTAHDAQALPVAKLREIFGADSALYIDIRQYGAVYTVLNSAAVVTLDGKLIDLRTGQQLWNGSATASSAEGQGSSGGGLVGLLVTALVNQVLNTVGDRSFDMAGIANQRMLIPGRPNALLRGPRSPQYGTD
jgi:hypothetical protein